MILRNATVILMNDPPAGKMAVLAMTTKDCLYFEAPMDDPRFSMREMTLGEVKQYFEEAGTSANPEAAAVFLTEIDALVKQLWKTGGPS